MDNKFLSRYVEEDFIKHKFYVNKCINSNLKLRRILSRCSNDSRRWKIMISSPLGRQNPINVSAISLQSSETPHVDVKNKISIEWRLTLVRHFATCLDSTGQRVMNLNTDYMVYDHQKTNQNKMADSYVQDELTRLRLKLVEQVGRNFITWLWRI